MTTQPIVPPAGSRRTPFRSSAGPVLGLAAVGGAMAGYLFYEGATYDDPVGAGLSMMLGILIAVPCAAVAAVYGVGIVTGFRSLRTAILGGVALLALVAVGWWFVASILY